MSLYHYVGNIILHIKTLPNTYISNLYTTDTPHRLNMAAFISFYTGNTESPSAQMCLVLGTWGRLSNEKPKAIKPSLNT